jgi:hypothetical protein
MRFLMNTLVALSSTAADSCVPTKPSLDALGLSCCRVSETCLTIIRAYRQGHIDSSQSFGTRSILLLKATPAAIAHSKALLAAICTSPSRYFSHTLSHVSRRLRPTFE